jgi:hypothetical protein
MLKIFVLTVVPTLFALSAQAQTPAQCDANDIVFTSSWNIEANILIANLFNSLSSSAGGYLFVPVIQGDGLTIHALPGIDKAAGEWPQSEQGGVYICQDALDQINRITSDCGFLSASCTGDGTLSVYVLPKN